MPIERMPDPPALVPGAEQAPAALEEAVTAAGLDARPVALCRRRAGSPSRPGEETS
jgi:hypothetical protein